MLKINIIAVGKIKEKYFTEGINEYTKRLSRFAEVNIIEIEEITYKKEDENLAEKIKKEEGQKILEKASGYIIAMAIEGIKLSSTKLASKINEIKANGYSQITFIIGGSYGLSNQVKSKANMLLSFSDCTFPHTLFRLMLVEQIYRACMINSGSSYHK